MHVSGKFASLRPIIYSLLVSFAIVLLVATHAHFRNGRWDILPIFLAGLVSGCLLAAGAYLSLRHSIGYPEQNATERTAELSRHVEQLNLINRVGRDATSVLELRALLPRVARLIRDSLSYQAVLVMMADQDTGQLRLEAAATFYDVDLLEKGLHLPFGQGLSGHVATSGEALVVGDVDIDPRYRRDERLPDIRSELALPMRIGSQVLGVLDLESSTKNAFCTEDVQVLQTLADQIAVAIHNARLYQAEAEARRTADMLREIGQVVNSTLDLDEVLAHILASLGEMLGYDSASIMLLKDDVLCLRAGRGFSSPTEVQGLQFRLADCGLNREVIESARPLIIGDVSKDRRWLGASVPGSKPIRSWMGVPLAFADNLVGMLTIDNYRPDAYDEADLPLVTAFANQAALALRNAELFQAAQTARAEAEEANQLKSQFLANMSHELRTPLNSVINFAYLLSMGSEGPTTPGQQDLLRRIGDAGNHLLGLINDILDWAKIEAGRIELFVEETELPELIDGVLSTAAGLLRDKPIELRKDISADLPAVRVDRTRIRQVLLNLISNAVKFTDSGNIDVCAKTGDEWVTLSVKDCGIGMEAKDIPRAFSEFVQLDGGAKRRVGGTGLGLPISKRFVEMHGGRMWAESEPGKGSVFFFTLPRACAPGTPLAAGVAPRESAGEGREKPDRK